MPSKRDRRRAITAEPPDEPAAPAEVRVIRFGSPRSPADRCTYLDTPAQFALCLECQYNHGAQGSGIVCAHRFGLDPTMVAGRKTQLHGDDILPVE